MELVVDPAHRDRVVKELTRHCGDGRLTLDELEERIAAAYAVETEAELRALLADLPPNPDLVAPSSAVEAPPVLPEPTPAPTQEVGLPDPAKAIGTLFFIGGWVLLFNGMFWLALICWFVLPGLVIHDRSR